MLTPGDEIDATIEKPAAGGRMIARHDGQILLVAGAIPGERVSVRIERVEKRLAFASAVRILAPSSDRRDAGSDPLCGGCVYAHIAYPRQVALKADIVADAFTRIGRIPIERPVPVAASPEAGYRMRASWSLRSRAPSPRPDSQAARHAAGSVPSCAWALPPSGIRLPYSLADALNPVTFGGNRPRFSRAIVFCYRIWLSRCSTRHLRTDASSICMREWVCSLWGWPRPDVTASRLSKAIDRAPRI